MSVGTEAVLGQKLYPVIAVKLWNTVVRQMRDVRPWIVKLSVICAVLFAVIRQRHVSGEQHVVPIQMFVEMNVVPAGKNVSMILSVVR